MKVVIDLSLSDAKHLVDAFHHEKKCTKTRRKAKNVLLKLAEQVDISTQWLETEKMLGHCNLPLPSCMNEIL